MNKLIWILVVVVIAVAAFFYFQSSPKTAISPASAPYGQANPSGAANAPSGATYVPSGNPDTIVSDILSETSQIAPTPSEADPSLVAPSTDISGSFDQSLNAGQF